MECLLENDGVFAGKHVTVIGYISKRVNEVHSTATKDLTPGQQVDQFFVAGGTLEECRTRAARYHRALSYVLDLWDFQYTSAGFL